MSIVAAAVQVRAPEAGGGTFGREKSVQRPIPAKSPPGVGARKGGSRYVIASSPVVKADVQVRSKYHWVPLTCSEAVQRISDLIGWKKKTYRRASAGSPCALCVSLLPRFPCRQRQWTWIACSHSASFRYFPTPLDFGFLGRPCPWARTEAVARDFNSRLIPQSTSNGLLLCRPGLVSAR